MKIFSSILLLLFAFTHSILAQETSLESGDSHSPPAFQLGLATAFGEESLIGEIDLVAPIWSLDKGNNAWIILNPRFVQMDGGISNGGLGLGLRRYFPEQGLILGGFLFYDSLWSRNSEQYNQFGLGVEIIHPKIEIRANYYNPESHQPLIAERSELETQIDETVVLNQTVGDPYGQGNQILQDITDVEERTVLTTRTTRFFQNFESALEGWDFELGRRLSIAELPGSFAFYAGYLSYSNPFGSNINGFMGRVGYAPTSNVEVGLEYFQDRNFLGDRWLGTARVQIPLGRSSSPSSSSSLERMEVRGKMLSQVRRSRMVTTAESGFLEDLTQLTVEEEIQVFITDNSRTDILLDNVVFVDNNRAIPRPDGTFESPWRSFDDATQRAPRDSTIYLRPGRNYEFATLNQSVTIIGDNPLNVFPGAPANTNSIVNTSGSPAGIFYATPPGSPANRSFDIRGLSFSGTTGASVTTFDVQDGGLVNVSFRNINASSNATFEALGVGSTINVSIVSSSFPSSPATTFFGGSGGVVNYSLSGVRFGTNPPVSTSGSSTGTLNPFPDL